MCQAAQTRAPSDLFSWGRTLIRETVHIYADHTRRSTTTTPSPCTSTLKALLAANFLATITQPLQITNSLEMFSQNTTLYYTITCINYITTTCFGLLWPSSGCLHFFADFGRAIYGPGFILCTMNEISCICELYG